MKKIILILLISISQLYSQNNSEQNIKRVTSIVDSTYANELVLIQRFEVKVPIDSLWNVYTTKRGWESAFVALAELDFRINGTIKTSYNKNATIGDNSTIVLNIINYVPKKLITLQAEISAHFPNFMKADEKDFYNIIYFEEVEDSLTRVISYGMGYKNTPKYLGLLKFFISGNESSYLSLIKYLETGERVKY